MIRLDGVQFANTVSMIRFDTYQGVWNMTVARLKLDSLHCVRLVMTVARLRLDSLRCMRLVITVARLRLDSLRCMRLVIAIARIRLDSQGV
jgi:hypothetical protein